MDSDDIKMLKGFKPLARIVFGPAFSILFDVLVDRIVEEYEQALNDAKILEDIVM